MVVAATLGALGCVERVRQPPAPPNILLITLDTTRADRIGAYGYTRAATPRLDALARDGVLFERAITAAPITLPAHASLMTGVYPFVHGVRNNGDFTLAETVPTLATTLKGRGYRTAAFVSAAVLDRRYGLARGFDHYDDTAPLERRGDQSAAAAIAWLNAGASATTPFFVWLHLFDPHDPYEPPSPFRETFHDRPYDGEVAFADSVVGTVLDRLDGLGKRASTLVAVAGDHGESLGEHEEDTHAVFVYDSTLRVPLMLSWPDRVPVGHRVSAPVRSIDLAPTLLDLAGQPPLPEVQGRSLVPLLTGNTAPPADAYAESYFPLLYMGWSPLRSLQEERWKFIEAPTPELYDLANDPGERTNLATREPARSQAMKRALDAVTGGGAGTMTRTAVDRDTAARLAALGYIGQSNAGLTPPSDGVYADPKAMIGVFNRLRRANAALRARRFGEAAAIARETLRDDAANAFAMNVLANAEMEMGRCREAIASYRAYLGRVPQSADAHQRIAICHARLGEPDRALAETEAALAIDARHADSRMLRGGLLAARGQTAAAIQELQQAVEIDPDNAPYRIGLARAQVEAGRLDEAGNQLRRALEIRPNDPDGHAAQGSLLRARGQGAAAIAAFDRSLQLRPDADDVRFERAETLEVAGRTAEARTEFERLASGPQTPHAIRRAARAKVR
jgi:choline-sulfatase